jgi:3alpha(or 20beta)-hydroxysteroid dehydrogenase
MKLSDLKIIVTGGAQGMGAHFARRLAEAGAQVAVGDVQETGLAALAEHTQGLPGQVHTRRLDVASETDVAEFVTWARQAMGGLNGLINNAGILRDGLLVKKDRTTGQVARLSREQWQQVIDVNLTGTFLGMQAVVEEMKKAGGGSIINVSSIEGLRGAPMVHPYVASKWAVRGLAKSAAIELGPKNIRVNSIHPGFIRTPMTKHFPDDMVTAPLRRPGQSEEVAPFVVFLVSDESSFATGAEFVMDGGLVTDVPHKPLPLG